MKSKYKIRLDAITIYKTTNSKKTLNRWSCRGIQENLRASKKRWGILFLYSIQNFLVDSISISIIKELNKFIAYLTFLSCKFSTSWDEFDLIKRDNCIKPRF